ncbi:MAG: ABC transporter permease [Thiothrix sp.]|nr:MAG: ABC transporter permease [Thiothrix sp.]
MQWLSDLANWSLLSLHPPGWGGVLLKGFAASITIALGAYTVGLLIGLWGAWNKLFGGELTRDLWGLYTTTIRAVPELVLILMLYFAGTDLVNTVLKHWGYEPIDINGFVAGVLVIGIVQGAYATEVLRGAILAIPRGQLEAAVAFGMGKWCILRRIILPAMLPFALPGLANLWLVVTKDTALLAVVGFSELTQVTRQAAGATKAYFLFYLAAGCLYLSLTLISTWLIKKLERWANRGRAQ